MPGPTDREIEVLLTRIISDGVNRALGALETAGAIDMREMRAKYGGAGAEYYDLVTEQIADTAVWSTAQMRQLFSEL